MAPETFNMDKTYMDTYPVSATAKNNTSYVCGQVDAEGASANGKAIGGQVGRTGGAVTVKAGNGSTANIKWLIGDG